MSAWRSSRTAAVVALCVLAFGMRAALYLAPPAELLPGAAGAWEEVHRGTTARELLAGPLLEPLDYQINGNWGGSLVIAFLAVPLYALLGAKLLVLRITTFGFTALGIGALFVLLDRFHGRRAAWIGGLLFALVPPGHALTAAQAWGTHIESQALVLLLAAIVLQREPSPRSAWRELALGAAMGFALYFAVSLAPAVCLLLWYELVSVRSLANRAAIVARAAGLVLGALPLLVLALELGPQGLANDSIVPILGTGEPGRPLRSLGRLLWHDIPRACYFPDFGALPGTAIGRVYTGLLVVAAAVPGARALRGPRASSARADGEGGPLAWFAAWQLAFFTLFYVSAGYDALARGELFRLRYALLPLPWAIAVAAPRLAQFAVREGRLSLPRLAPGIAAAGLCALGTIGRLEPANGAALASAPGYSDWFLGRFVVARAREPGEMTRAAERLLARPDRSRRGVILGSMGRQLQGMERLSTSDDPSALAILEAARRARAELEAALPPDLLAMVFAPIETRNVPEWRLWGDGGR